MLNQLVMVGRLVKEPEVKETENGNKFTNITIAIPRSYKNADGEYETDFVDCVLWNQIAENTAEFCKSGDLIGVRGRLQTKIVEKDDGTKSKKSEVLAERITFLSTAKEKTSSMEEEPAMA